MEKLMKNWVFTLVACVLLALTTLVFLLGALGVLDFAQVVLNLIVATVLTLYTVFTLFPLVKRYHGVTRAFELGEIAILLFAAACQVLLQFDLVPAFAELPVCSALGLALWLRGVVETVRAYESAGDTNVPTVPLRKLCGYILLSAIGVWQMVRPLIPDVYFLWCVAAIAFLTAGIFGYATAQNRRALPPKAKKEKKEKSKKEKNKAEALPAEKVEAPAPAVAPQQPPETKVEIDAPQAEQPEEEPAEKKTETLGEKNT